jgi:ankyrin repeat protein
VKLALFALISAGDTHRVCQLLETDHGLLEARNDYVHDTPLMFAVQGGLMDVHNSLLRVDVAKVLIQKGADLEATTGHGGRSGWRALHYAVNRIDTDVAALHVRLLIRSGVDVMARTAAGDTALILAAKRRGYMGPCTRNPVLVELLLEQMRGRGLDWRDEQGRTALYSACEGDDLEKVRALLYHGADHTVADVHGTTPMMLAAPGFRTSHRGVMKLLMVSGFAMMAHCTYIHYLSS